MWCGSAWRTDRPITAAIPDPPARRKTVADYTPSRSSQDAVLSTFGSGERTALEVMAVSGLESADDVSRAAGTGGGPGGADAARTGRAQPVGKVFYRLADTEAVA